MSDSLFRVLEIRHLAANCFRLRVERKDFVFKSGQCVNIGLPKSGVNREYSTYSGESETSHMDFLIRQVEGGSVSPALAKLKAGDFVEIHGAYGSFTLPPDAASRQFTFIATGTGIAPFHSFVKSVPGLDYRILHGIREKGEMYEVADYERGRYTACVSRTLGGDFHGRVTDYLKEHPADPARTFFLCGNRAMINEVYDLLRSQGVNGDRLFTEVFF